MMLGSSREQDAARFANQLFAGPWTHPAVEAQEGYARDHFHALLDSPTPPPDLPGNIWRALERLTWQIHRTFTVFQAQQRRLTEAAGR